MSRESNNEVKKPTQTAGKSQRESARLNLYVFKKPSQNYTPNKLIVKNIENALEVQKLPLKHCHPETKKHSILTNTRQKEPAFIQLYGKKKKKIIRQYIGRQQLTLKQGSSIIENCSSEGVEVESRELRRKWKL